ncbi:MAG: hypothetical protein MJH10_14460 [Epibacterium sp.]|nr:hypothetical protein [Epibacterium sp.]NQX74730.1 hypothetical protein [Epibacterium sp.]
MFEQSAKTFNEETTQQLYKLCNEFIEFSESLAGEDFAEQGDDRMTIALSPIFAALFVQAKHRYRPPLSSSVITAATMIRNFAMADELSEMGLVAAVHEFMDMMNAASGSGLVDINGEALKDGR